MPANRNLQLGVFMPVGNNGWMMSTTGPQYLPTWELNRDVALLLEDIGFDYVFSMAKWRGMGGATKYWDTSVESVTLMTSLAAVTQRLRVFASVCPSLIHPAVFAKIAATSDDICGGRLALNVVSAGNYGEYSQMGLYPDDFESYRYEYYDEWLSVLKALWTEPSVTFDGRFFHLDDCQSEPKPRQKPWPSLILATSSERGFEFAADHCNEVFVSGRTDRVRAYTEKVRQVAAERERELTVHTQIIMILGDDDADAERKLEVYRAGADWEAIARVYTHGPDGTRTQAIGQEIHRRFAAGDQAYIKQVQEQFNEPQHLFYHAPAYWGGPETIADVIEDLTVNGGVDGMVITPIDYLPDLRRFHRDVMPLLRQRNLIPAEPVAV